MDTCQLLRYLNTSNKPDVTCSDVETLMWDVYGLRVKECQDLDSYIDRNFRLTVSADVMDNPHLSKILPRGYVLKIVNVTDSARPEIPEAQLNVMKYLKLAGISCPDIIPTKDNKCKGTWRNTSEVQTETLDTTENGNSVFREENPSTKSTGYVVFLCAYHPGDVLYKTRPYSTHLSYSCGLFAGRVDRLLKEYLCPDSLSNNQSVWDLRSTPCLLDILEVIPSCRNRELVKEILEDFQTVLKMEHLFQKGVIHGDLSEHNILVGQNREGESEVTAILDFGDTSVSCYIYELSILICYIMMDSPDENVFETGGHVIAGYLNNMYLNEDEWSVLKTCIAVRMCQSLVMGAYAHSCHPRNDYVTVTSRKGWDCLNKLWKFPENQLISIWKKIISSYETQADGS